jgi:hypothetical protein
MTSKAPAKPDAKLSLRFLLIILLAGFAWGAVVKVALADHYHVACVGHGFVHGESTTDGSFFSRVEPGCGSTFRQCQLYSNGSFVGSSSAGGNLTCNLWSRSIGNFTECASTAHTYSAGVFSNHVHKAHNWCG